MKQEILDRLVGNIEQEVAYRLKGKMAEFQDDMYSYFKKYGGLSYWNEIVILPGDAPRTLKAIVSELSKVMLEQCRKDAIGEICESVLNLNKAETKRSKEISEIIDRFKNGDISVVTTGSLMDGFINEPKPEPEPTTPLKGIDYIQQVGRVERKLTDYQRQLLQEAIAKGSFIIVIDKEWFGKVPDDNDKQE